MTSQERVLTSLKHQQPDHVSVNLPGDLSSGTAAMAYPKLRTTTKTQELASVARALRSKIDRAILGGFGGNHIATGPGDWIRQHHLEMDQQRTVLARNHQEER